MICFPLAVHATGIGARPGHPEFTKGHWKKDLWAVASRSAALRPHRADFRLLHLVSERRGSGPTAATHPKVPPSWLPKLKNLEKLWGSATAYSCHPSPLGGAPAPERQKPGVSHGNSRCWAQSLSAVWLLVAPWTAACQAPLSTGFSRQEYWSGLSYPSPKDL